MTHASLGYGYSYPMIGFARPLSTKRRKGISKKKSQPDFKPSDEQIRVTVGCIRGRLGNLGSSMTHYTSVRECDFEFDGYLDLTAMRDEAIKRAADELYENIHSNTIRLGSNRHEVTITIEHALRRGIERDNIFTVVVNSRSGAVGIRLEANRKCQYVNDNARRRGKRKGLVRSGKAA